MDYRRIGSAGLKLSVLSLGSWVTYGRQVDVDAAAACMKAGWALILIRLLLMAFRIG